MGNTISIAAAVLFALALAARCEDDESSKSTPAPSASSAPITAFGSEREALLAELGSQLDRVQTAKPGDHLTTGSGIDVGPLVGMTRGELRAALGAPHTCEKNEVTGKDGKKLPVAPCQNSTDWFYSFYHLPEGWLGGGPELLLGFDDQGVCRSARWMFTQ